MSPQQDINLPLVSRPEGDCWNRGTDILPVLVGERRYRRAFSRPMAIKCNRTEKGLNRTGARTETTSAVLKNLDFFFPSSSTLLRNVQLLSAETERSQRPSRQRGCVYACACVFVCTCKALRRDSEHVLFNKCNPHGDERRRFDATNDA